MLNCGTIDTAYYLWDPNDLSNYSNYDTANRPDNSFIKFIVIHDTEETYDATTKLPPNPNYFASFHYLVKSDDGHVDQALDTKNVAWQAGNWWINTHSIGIEQEGWASRGARWFTEKLYHSTAKLVQYLAWKYQIPLDRAHIIGHDNVTGGGSNPATMHWDPGPYWDWNHFMNLVGAPIIPTATPHGNVVTIKPNFTNNKIVYSGCVPSNEPVEGGVCGTSPAQSSSWVQLRTAPSDDAPLLNDPYIHPGGVPGTNNYSDVGDTAPTGAKYVIADQLRRLDRDLVRGSGSLVQEPAQQQRDLLVREDHHAEGGRHARASTRRRGRRTASCRRTWRPGTPTTTTVPTPNTRSRPVRATSSWTSSRPTSSTPRTTTSRQRATGPTTSERRSTTRSGTTTASTS